MGVLRASVFFSCFSLLACGGKLADDTSFDAGGCDGAKCVDASSKPDALPSPPIDAGEEPPPAGPCTVGPNVGLPTAECGGDQVDWFATPYTPPSDVTVNRVEAHMAQGNVALLADANGQPGAALFVGALGTSTSSTWLGADVSPPILLHGGTPYWIGFQGDCSFASGGSEPVEYMAPSVNGPWHVQGTDNWTARLIGTCQ